MQIEKTKYFVPQKVFYSFLGGKYRAGGIECKTDFQVTYDG